MPFREENYKKLFSAYLAMQKTILQKYDSQIVCPKKEVNIRDKNSKDLNWKKKLITRIS